MCQAVQITSFDFVFKCKNKRRGLPYFSAAERNSITFTKNSAVLEYFLMQLTKDLSTFWSNMLYLSARWILKMEAVRYETAVSFYQTACHHILGISNCLSRAFAKLPKVTISIVMSVCLSGPMAQHGSHWMDFDEI